MALARTSLCLIACCGVVLEEEVMTGVRIRTAKPVIQHLPMAEPLHLNYLQALGRLQNIVQLRHENLVNLLEVCKKKKRWYLVFEFVDHTILDDLEQFPNGLDTSRVRKYLFQIIKGIGFCHSHNIIHRDIKPENILVSQSGVVKLCDFGFARALATPGEEYTEYVATRWYRAPELLVGDIKYGKAVDLWAIGCLVTEMLTGEPLFPGDSDIDQLYHIMKCLGNLTPRHTELFYKNPLFVGVRLPEIREVEPLERRYPKLPSLVLDVAKKCLQIDPDRRPPCAELLQHDLFSKDGFADRFPQELSVKIQKDARDNHYLPKKSKLNKKEKEDFPEDRPMLAAQDFNSDPKIKEAKPFKIKLLKSDSEKTGTHERSSHFNSLFDGGGGSTKTIPQATLKESSSSLDYPKNPAMQIPPIAHNLSAIASSMSVTSGIHSYRPEEKPKKYISPFKKHGQLSPASHYNLNVATSVANDKNLLQTNKKKWDFSRTDVRLPELSHSHLPELKGADIRNMKLLKKENRLAPESRIPSLAALDLHNASMALQQISGNALQDASDANFPRVEH